MGNQAIRFGASVCGPSCIDPVNFEVDSTNVVDLTMYGNAAGAKRKPAKPVKGSAPGDRGEGQETPPAKHAADPPGKIQQALILERLGIAADEVRSHDESEKLFRQAIQLRSSSTQEEKDDEALAVVFTNLGVSLAKQSRFEEARTALVNGRNLHRAANNGSEQSQKCAGVIMNLSMVAYEQSVEVNLDEDPRSFETANAFCDEAEKLLRIAEQIFEEVLGDKNPFAEKTRRKSDRIQKMRASIENRKKITTLQDPWDQPSPELAAKLEKQRKIIRAASEAKMAKKPAEIEEESDGDESEDTNAETEDEGDDWKMGVSGAQKALSPEIIRRSSREQRPKPKRATYLLFGSSK